MSRLKFGPVPVTSGLNCPMCGNTEGLTARYHGWSVWYGNRVLLYCPFCNRDHQLPPELNWMVEPR